MFNTIDDAVAWAAKMLSQAREFDGLASTAESDTTENNFKGQAKGIRDTVESMLRVYLDA